MLVAAGAVLPLLALYLTHPRGVLAAVETGGHWAVWLTFMVAVVVMLSVVRDQRAWIDGHRFELLVVALSSPLVPLALALAPALRLLVLAKVFKALKLAKAIKLAKLGKSVRLLHRKLALRCAARRRSPPACLRWCSRLERSPRCSRVTRRSRAPSERSPSSFAGMLATFGVSHLGRRVAER